MSTSATPTDVTAESTITSVTVFEEGAQIFRQATVDIGKGISKVIFEKLPATLKRDTLQVALRSTNPEQEALIQGILLKGISMESKTVDNEEYDKETDVRTSASKRIEKIDAELQQLQDAKSLLDRKKQFVGANFGKATSTSTNQEKESSKTLDVAYWKKMVNSTVKHGADNLVERRTIEAQIDKFNTEKTQLQSTLNGHVPQKKKTHEFVAVLLDAKEGVSGLGMQISYLMDEAKWKPTYDVRVTNNANTTSGDGIVEGVPVPDEKVEESSTTTTTTTGNSATGGSGSGSAAAGPPAAGGPSAASASSATESSINLSYNGSIEQWGPENWEGISLDLSTAKPSMSGSQPNLVPWHVGLYKVHATAGGSRGRASSMAYKSMESCEEPGSMSSYSALAGEAAAQVNTTAISQSFTVQGKQTISNDRKVCRVTLVQIPLKATFDYVAVPKEQEVAYARAKVENTSEYFLMPGQSSIFLNDQYIAQSRIPKVCPKEKFDVDVGRDEGVLIERKQLKKQTSEESGILSGKKTSITYKYQLKVTNKKAGPISVKLEEAVPHSWQGEIEVKYELPVLPEEHSDDLYRDHSHILHAIVRPKPNTSATIVVQYKVTYPTGRQVVGL